MKSRLIRKIIIALIFLLPAISFNSCKKQVRCGCDGDILSSITDYIMDYSSITYSSNGGTASFAIFNGMSYDYYHFCNPNEMYERYLDLEGQSQIKISGDMFWDCTYMMNSSSTSYYSYYKIYNIKVTELKSSLYGKK
ncbi:MAG: hypothetical protein V1903_14420 [Bacteroidota bacterium]